MDTLSHVHTCYYPVDFHYMAKVDFLLHFPICFKDRVVIYHIWGSQFGLSEEPEGYLAGSRR